MLHKFRAISENFARIDKAPKPHLSGSSGKQDGDSVDSTFRGYFTMPIKLAGHKSKIIIIIMKTHVSNIAKWKLQPSSKWGVSAVFVIVVASCSMFSNNGRLEII